mmetsp:Transcript_4626/g.12409  ORF Transcript_4626/g.12409 Transcript_4626/m.12409 type:complete len:223 (-) Transcript_4626:168-836(-)
MTELMKKLRVPMTGMSRCLLEPMILLMPAVTTPKPPKWSMDSTTAMAGNRKRTMPPTSSRPLSRWRWNSSRPSGETVGWYLAAVNTHIEAAKMSITADLLMPTTSSTATRISPMTKSTDIILLNTMSLCTSTPGGPKSESRRTKSIAPMPTTFTEVRQWRRARSRQFLGCGRLALPLVGCSPSSCGGVSGCPNRAASGEWQGVVSRLAALAASVSRIVSAAS